MARRLREHLLSLRASRPKSQYTERAAKRLKSWLPKLGKSTYEIAVKVINKSPIIINAASSNPGATFGRGQRPEGVKPDLEATARCRKPYASYRRTGCVHLPALKRASGGCSLLNCPSGARMRSARHLWKRLTSARADALVATFATAVSLPASLCATQPSSSKAGQVFTHNLSRLAWGWHRPKHRDAPHQMSKSGSAAGPLFCYRISSRGAKSMGVLLLAPMQPPNPQQPKYYGDRRSLLDSPSCDPVDRRLRGSDARGGSRYRSR